MQMKFFANCGVPISDCGLRIANWGMGKDLGDREMRRWGIVDCELRNDINRGFRIAECGL